MNEQFDPSDPFDGHDQSCIDPATDAPDAHCVCLHAENCGCDCCSDRCGTCYSRYPLYVVPTL